MTWRLPVRLSAVSSCCAWLKSGTTLPQSGDLVPYLHR
jgi:hypothetical protein